MEFRDPLFFLLLLLVVPAVLFAFYRTTGKGVLGFSSVKALKGLPLSLRMRLRQLLPLLLCAALVFLTIALARPREGKQIQNIRTKGIAAMMVIDRSGSMAQGMSADKSRLEVSKDVFKSFVTGDDTHDLAGRANDMVGLITFGSFPTVMCPLTRQHNALVTRTENLDAFTAEKYGRQLAGKFGRTAVGDALKLAVAKLVTVEDKLKEAGAANFEIKSKVVILLTDGENNVGSEPMEAAEMAAKHGIKVYAIGIGDDGASRSRDAFGGFFITAFGRGGADMEMLNGLAEKTGGFARLAANEKALADIYREIDLAEKSEIEEKQYMEYDEQYKPWLLTGIILYMAFFLLDRTFLARMP